MLMAFTNLVKWDSGTNQVEGKGQGERDKEEGERERGRRLEQEADCRKKEQEVGPNYPV